MYKDRMAESTSMKKTNGAVKWFSSEKYVGQRLKAQQQEWY